MKIANHHTKSNRSVSLEIADKVHRKSFGLIFSVLLLVVVLVWSYQSVFLGLYSDWLKDPDSSVGLLVPLTALILLWHERHALKICRLRPCWLWGLILLLLSQAARIWSLLFFYQSGVRYSLILTIASLVLLVCGGQVFRRVFWILLFLFLMVPTPTRIQNLINAPLQTIATSWTVFLLEVFGIEVLQEGNIVMLNGTIPMAVAEACNGLRLLTAFIIVTAFFTYLMKCSRPRKAILLLSSIPIALICNILRLFLTALIMLIVSAQAGHKFFHDFAGFFMMPLAVVLLFAEPRLMNKIIAQQLSVDKGNVMGHSDSSSKGGSAK